MKIIFFLLCIMSSAVSVAAQDKTFLPVEQAFPFSYSVADNALVVDFKTTPGYYLYHKRFSFKADSSALTLGTPIYSVEAEIKDDPNFGQVKVYHQPLSIRIPFEGSGTAKVRFQGCSDDGLCYLPKTKSIALSTVVDNASGLLKTMTVESVSALSTNSMGLASALQDISKLQALLLFFVLGAGLALTPCVLPMIPILSSIIGGQRGPMTGWKGFMIALAYVLGMASSYALAGVLTATLGQGINLQTAMQQTWVLVVFASIFTALALAMFGFYELQLPSRLQASLNSQSQRFRGGKAVTVFVMGAVSALVVSPCVSAPLAGALLYVSTTQDWLFGGAALFVLALGMGIPLLVIGATGGKFLPKNGPWMVTVKQLFGAMLLGVAILLVSRFSSPSVTLLLWAILCIGCAIHFGALESAQSGWQRTRKTGAFLTLLYGIALLIGAGTGADDPFQPLAQVKGSTNSISSDNSSIAMRTSFQKVDDINVLNEIIQDSMQSQQLTMVDLYADWCSSCKVMDKTVFQDSAVAAALTNLKTVKLDVTNNTSQQSEWLESKLLFGPPAILFFGPQGDELKELRIVGEISQPQMLAHLARLP
ncbi:MAG: protein-disulfide reductase DsbD [Moritella sp.]|uniref:protein-disulfide reductase DsbD n=1 Tax=Moritella sp. TaxID=78556 RepID=UPI0025CEF81F|nr:protein-disulfide reductase DsbD [Moritella sp.]NQZ90868.1 protein-disulfide reductase DsbD [Moritella sp.]